MTWQRRAGRCAAILAGVLAASVLTALPALPALAWGVSAAALSRGPSSPGPGGGGGAGGSSDALLSLVVAVALVGVAAWGALVLRGLSGQRRRSSGTPGRHRRANEAASESQPADGEDHGGEQQGHAPPQPERRDDRRPGNQHWGGDRSWDDRAEGDRWG